jgi:hypothetical protein
MRCLIFVLLVSLGLLETASAASSGPMRFVVFNPCGGGRSCGCAQQVLASGRVESDSADKLFRFVVAEQAAGRLCDTPTVSFDSPGGSLVGGMRLGRIVRQLKMDTGVALTYSHVQTDGTSATIAKDVICASACTLAFLGGIERSVTADARFGVHQFFSARGDVGDSATQTTVAVVSSYVAEMGVQRALVEFASSVPPEQIRFLSRDVLVKLNVDNTSAQMPQWVLRSLADGTVVASVTETRPNSNRSIELSLFRARDGAKLSIRFHPGGRNDQLAEAASRLEGRGMSVAANGESVHEIGISRWRVEGQRYVEATIGLPETVVAKLRKATTVGVSFDASMADAFYMPDASFNVDPGSGVIIAATK